MTDLIDLQFLQAKSIKILLELAAERAGLPLQELAQRCQPHDPKAMRQLLRSLAEEHGLLSTRRAAHGQILWTLNGQISLSGGRLTWQKYAPTHGAGSTSRGQNAPVPGENAPATKPGLPRKAVTTSRSESIPGENAPDLTPELPRKASPSPVGNTPVSASPSPVGNAPASASPSPVENTPISASPSPVGNAPVLASPSPVENTPISASPSPVGNAPVSASPSLVENAPAPASPSLVENAPVSASPSPVTATLAPASPSPGENAPFSATDLPHEDPIPPQTNPSRGQNAAAGAESLIKDLNTDFKTDFKSDLKTDLNSDSLKSDKTLEGAIFINRQKILALARDGENKLLLEKTNLLFAYPVVWHAEFAEKSGFELLAWLAQAWQAARQKKSDRPWGIVYKGLRGQMRQRLPDKPYRSDPWHYLPAAYLEACGLLVAGGEDALEIDEVDPPPELELTLPPTAEEVRLQNAWQETLTKLEANTPRQVFEKWIRGTHPLEWDAADGVLTVAAGSEERAAWLQDRLASTAQNWLRGILLCKVKINFLPE